MFQKWNVLDGMPGIRMRMMECLKRWWGISQRGVGEEDGGGGGGGAHVGVMEEEGGNGTKGWVMMEGMVRTMMVMVIVVMETVGDGDSDGGVDGDGGGVGDGSDVGDSDWGVDGDGDDGDEDDDDGDEDEEGVEKKLTNNQWSIRSSSPIPILHRLNLFPTYRRQTRSSVYQVGLDEGLC
jgi:hypothetical protein